MNASYERLERATADLDPPFALVDLDALWSNADDLVRRAAGKPIRLATKSLRCRALQEAVLARPGFQGALAFTLREAQWLSSAGFNDIVIAYPTADRAALRDLAWSVGERPDTGITLMIDSVEHLDLIDSATGQRGAPLRVAIDIDAGLHLFGDRLKLGAKRSPIFGVDDAVALARTIVERDGFELDGLMAYEAQIAGVGNAPANRVKGIAVRAMQARSAGELATRRAEIVRAVSRIAPVRFVNGGGTGSLESTAAEDVVTEVAAGSGLYGPVLFDLYRGFSPRPAAMFALPVVRRPGPGVATLLGGGYIASGPSDKHRLPQPFLPEGLRLDRQEGAGEVQTPVLGSAADRLRVGDRVYLRHAKAGELCERFDALYLVAGDAIVEMVPTYRGEGKTFL